MPRLYHLNLYTPLRKSLRNNATKPEKILWQYLRLRRFNGLKFKRQESIGRYIVDFYCPEKRLVIELDGAGHDDIEQLTYDRERTEYLNSCFIKVVRFRNEEVMRDISGVIKKLEAVMLTPTPGPPPEFGRGSERSEWGGG